MRGSTEPFSGGCWAATQVFDHLSILAQTELWVLSVTYWRSWQNNFRQTCIPLLVFSRGTTTLPHTLPPSLPCSANSWWSQASPLYFSAYIVSFLILLAVLWNVNFSIHQGEKKETILLKLKFQHQQLSLQIPEKHNGRGSHQVILLSLARSNFTWVSSARRRFNPFCELCSLPFVAIHISAPLTLQRISTASNVNLSFWNLSSLLHLTWTWRTDTDMFWQLLTYLSNSDFPSQPLLP